MTYMFVFQPLTKCILCTCDLIKISTLECKIVLWVTMTYQ